MWPVEIFTILTFAITTATATELLTTTTTAERPTATDATIDTTTAPPDPVPDQVEELAFELQAKLTIGADTTTVPPDPVPDPVEELASELQARLVISSFDTELAVPSYWPMEIDTVSSPDGGLLASEVCRTRKRGSFTEKPPAKRARRTRVVVADTAELTDVSN